MATSARFGKEPAALPEPLALPPLEAMLLRATPPERAAVLADVEARIAQALARAQAHQHMVQEAGRVGTYEIDIGTGITRGSPICYDLFALPRDTGGVAFDRWVARIHPDDQPWYMELSTRTRRLAQEMETEYRILAPDGSVRWVLSRNRYDVDGGGRAVRAYGTVQDITDRKTAEARIWHAANHDALTKLPNRALFHDRLGRMIAAARDCGGQVGLAIFDLDHLKHVNDTLGHPAGDAMLCAAAGHLSACAGNGAVGRLGGDEFALAVLVAGAGELLDRAQAALTALRTPVAIANAAFSGRATAGVALFPQHAEEAGELVKSADLALNTGKAQARGAAILYCPAMREHLNRRLSGLADARAALKDGRIAPFYQPKIDLVTGRVTGFEALMRWRQPGGRWQPPAAIALAFHDPELAPLIGERMHERIIADARRWLDMGLDFGRIAINTAPAELVDGMSARFAERLLARLDRARVPPSRVEIEVTEGVFLGAASDGVEAVLRTLCNAHVTIALDDFGTGYASLIHLKRFPVDVIKIDGSFVRDLGEKRDSAAIVRAVVALARDLGLTIVAEGIEKPAQAAFLRANGCAQGQGWLYARAMPAGRVPAFVARRAAQA